MRALTLKEFSRNFWNHSAFALLFSLGLITMPAQAEISYVGIGVTIEQLRSKDIQIVDLVPGGPAERAGVLIGELLRGVDGVAIQGRDFEEVGKMLRGDSKPGSVVIMTLENPPAPTDSPTPPMPPTTRDVSVTREIITIPCFLEGQVNLRLSGDDRSGWISGWIGNENVHLNVSFGRASGWIKNEHVSLYMDKYMRDSYTLSGHIRGSYVNWRSFGNYWNDWEQCIP